MYSIPCSCSNKIMAKLIPSKGASKSSNKRRVNEIRRRRSCKKTNGMLIIYGHQCLFWQMLVQKVFLLFTDSYGFPPSYKEKIVELASKLVSRITLSILILHIFNFHCSFSPKKKRRNV